MSTSLTPPLPAEGKHLCARHWRVEVNLRDLLSERSSLQVKAAQLEMSEPSPVKPAIAWNWEFATVFHIWEGQASAIVWGLLSLTPSNENRNLRPCNTLGQSVNQRKLCNVEKMTSYRFGLEGICDEKKTSPQTCITRSTWSKCLETSIIQLLSSFLHPISYICWRHCYTIFRYAVIKAKDGSGLKIKRSPRCV